MAWIQAVTIAPIEVEAALTYLESTSLHPGFVHSNGTLTGSGIAVAGVCMALFTWINLMGVRWLAESNNITMIWKPAVPTLTIIVLLIVTFNGSNFSANSGGGFAPFGAKGSSPRSRWGWCSPWRGSSRPSRSAVSPEIPSTTFTAPSSR